MPNGHPRDYEQIRNNQAARKAAKAKEVRPIEPEKPEVAPLPQPKFDLDATVYFVYRDNIEVECDKCKKLTFWTKKPRTRPKLHLDEFTQIACPFCLGKKVTTEFQWTSWVATVIWRMAVDEWRDGSLYCGGSHGPREGRIQYTLRLPSHGANTCDHGAPSSIYETDAFATPAEAKAEAAERNEAGD